jgi:hypothetical protein
MIDSGARRSWLAIALNVSRLGDPPLQIGIQRQHRLLGQLAIGDVLADADQADQLAAVVEHRVRPGVQVADRPVRAKDPLVVRVRDVLVEDPVGRVDHPLAIVGVDQREVALVARFVDLRRQAVDPEQLLRPAGVRLADVPLPGAEVRDPLRVDHQLLAAPQPRLGPLQLADVRRQIEQRRHVAARTGDRRYRAREPGGHAAQPLLAPLEALRARAAQHRRTRGRERRQPGGGEQRRRRRAGRRLRPARGGRAVREQQPPVETHRERGIGAVLQRRGQSAKIRRIAVAFFDPRERHRRSMPRSARRSRNNVLPVAATRPHP